MQYNLFYIQEFKNGDPPIRSNLSFETRNAAVSRYHSELAQVGISETLSKVTAMVFKDDLNVVIKGSEVLQEVQTQAAIESET